MFWLDLSPTHHTQLPNSAEVNVSVAPGTSENYIGARKDVTEENCEKQGEVWVSTGSVTNSDETSASYRVYVAFNSPEGAMIALVQNDLDDVPPSGSSTWETRIDSAPEGMDIVCVLRVEKTN